MREWDWLSLYQGYGCAFRDYAFAARVGKLAAGKLDSNYLALCQAEIQYAADYAVGSSADNAYGSSFSDENKGLRVAGWYFSGEQTFDLAVGYLLNPQPAYLDGFSPNVQDILNSFEFRNQIPRLSKADALGQLIEKFLDKDINLSPLPVGELPGLDNHSMGTLFEDLVRMFNEENNTQAGEHWTPRDAVRLMANLNFLPVADRISLVPICSTTALAAPAACSPSRKRPSSRSPRAHGKQVADPPLRTGS